MGEARVHALSEFKQWNKARLILSHLLSLIYTRHSSVFQLVLPFNLFSIYCFHDSDSWLWQRVLLAQKGKVVCPEPLSYLLWHCAYKPHLCSLSKSEIYGHQVRTGARFIMLIRLAVFEAATFFQSSVHPLMFTTKKQAVARWWYGPNWSFCRRHPGKPVRAHPGFMAFCFHPLKIVPGW